MFHTEGYCPYGERCQFLHSIYDLKKPLDYLTGIKECARLTLQRAEQIDNEQTGAEIQYINLITGSGGGAPTTRLSVFEKIYNKDDYFAQRQQKNIEK